MEGVVYPEEVPDRVGSPEGYCRRPDDRRVQEHESVQGAGSVAELVLEALRYPARVGEVAEVMAVRKSESTGDHHGYRTDNSHERAENCVGTLVIDPARCYPLVDDVGLLEEKLPRGDGRTDYGDYEQHRS